LRLGAAAHDFVIKRGKCWPLMFEIFETFSAGLRGAESER